MGVECLGCTDSSDTNDALGYTVFSQYVGRMIVRLEYSTDSFPWMRLHLCRLKPTPLRVPGATPLRVPVHDTPAVRPLRRAGITSNLLFPGGPTFIKNEKVWIFKKGRYGVFSMFEGLKTWCSRHTTGTCTTCNGSWPVSCVLLTLTIAFRHIPSYQGLSMHLKSVSTLHRMLDIAL